MARTTLYLVRHAHLVEALQDGAGGLGLDARVQRHHRRRRHLHRQVDQRQQDSRAGADQRDQPTRRQRLQIGDKIAHAPSPYMPVETRK